VNILIAMFSDEIKRKYPMISTWASAIENKERYFCGVYINLNGVAIGSKNQWSMKWLS
jgi:hypothetical protein